VPTVSLEEASEGAPLTDPKVATELPHSDLERPEVVSLIGGVFEPILQGVAGPFDDLSVDHLIGEHAAIISGEQRPELGGIAVGPPQHALEGNVLLESTYPLIQNGEAVDLSLVDSGSALESVNPLVPVQIPSDLGEGIALPEAGIEFELEDAPSRSPSVVADTAVYPNVATDTDLVVAPAPNGFETMTAFRTAEAPTSQSFKLNLPSGSELRQVDEGAAVYTGDQKVAEVHSPTALDASGAAVPVDMAVEGRTITLTIHPQPSDQFPILADPLVEAQSWGNGSVSTWERFTTDPTWMVTQCCSQGPDMVGAGMAARALGRTYSPNSDDHWLYYVPRYHQGVQEGQIPTSFIAGLTLSNIRTKGSSGSSSPYFYAGIWDPATGSWAGKAPYQALWAREGSLPNIIGGSISFTNGNDQQAQEAEAPGIHTNEYASVSDNREMIVGGATVEFGDVDAPEVLQPSASATWSNQTGASSIAATVTDRGLGAKRAEFVLPGQGAKIVQNPCVGTVGYPCPSSWRATLGASEYNAAAMPQGWLSIPVWGEDLLATGRRSPPMPKSASTTRVRTYPRFRERWPTRHPSALISRNMA